MLAGGVIVDGDINGAVRGSTGGLVQRNGLRGVDGSACRALLPIGGFGAAELIDRGRGQAGGGIGRSLLKGNRLAGHPSRAGALIGDVANGTDVPRALDSGGRGDAGGKVDNGAAHWAEGGGGRCSHTHGSGGKGKGACLQEAATR